MFVLSFVIASAKRHKRCSKVEGLIWKKNERNIPCHASSFAEPVSKILLSVCAPGKFYASKTSFHYSFFVLLLKALVLSAVIFDVITT